MRRREEGGEGMRVHIKYEAAQENQVMPLQVEIEDGHHKEIILTNVSVGFREKLVPFLLSFEAE